MILFVFEGGKAEPLVFDSLAKLFLTGEDVRVVTCEHDLPTLFTRLKKNDYDLFRSLPLKENGIEIPDGLRIDTLFSQIFLFFDYDFHNRIGVEKVNEILEEMLEYFDDETVNGKLYVNYPMIESLKYTKEMDVKTWNFNQFADSLQKARNYADKYKYKCCCPDCGEIAIKSHLLQRHPLLTSIADSQNKVLQFEDNWEDARSRRWDLYSKKARMASIAA